MRFGVMEEAKPGLAVIVGGVRFDDDDEEEKEDKEEGEA